MRTWYLVMAFATVGVCFPVAARWAARCAAESRAQRAVIHAARQASSECHRAQARAEEEREAAERLGWIDYEFSRVMAARRAMDKVCE